jgi:uncharacterized glyoxalase superfamily protein PhnB
MSDLSVTGPTFVSAVYYRDPAVAVSWLEKAFGFEITMAIEDPGGDPTMIHYEMSCEGRGRIMVGGEWADSIRSPASLGGVNTQGVHVTVEGDVDAHCERARAAGAVISAEPEDQFYGDRVYRAVDLEGHQWTFSMHVRNVSRAEAEAAIGTKIRATNWA